MLRIPNIRHMRVFLVAVQTGSISLAAQECHLSQPAASQAIAGLEAEVGAQLLVRRTRDLVPTPCGAMFVRRVEAALQHLRFGARGAQRAATGEARKRAHPFDTQMTAAQLRALIAIANTGSFTVAAMQLGLSQPTVHRAARNLEALAAVPLFTATAVGVELTASAQALVLGAKLAHSEIRQGIEEIGTELGQDRGTINLGSMPLARTSIVPRAVHDFVQSTEGAQVRVVDGRYPQLLRSLREGDLDLLIGAMRSPCPAEDVVQETLFHDDLAIVARPQHPLFRKAEVTLDDTLNYPWVAPPRETPAGQYLYETLRIHERAVTPVRVVSSSLVFLRGTLALGDYITIISRHQISVEEGLGKILPLPIRLEGNARAIGLTYRSNWRPTATQKDFIEKLRRVALASQRVEDVPNAAV
ncbi:LysR family transcriptional regulator [Pseudoprimorskyibacter insulae]|uniref:HTH-type transcriptional regulator TsaR n=1 Tax=Pseudoprimorskyibacter insulae TaxID=1695997 RepID=A0A2R8AUB6_9RHOB|nr:LysR family transcriptional regulator [Pseudoprimorskyibacter insulae]SPF79570.1 HTH-type transcriptional regulator TsaR [Pseudoprimorskyibacter insulae]